MQEKMKIDSQLFGYKRLGLFLDKASPKSDQFAQMATQGEQCHSLLKRLIKLLKCRHFVVALFFLGLGASSVESFAVITPNTDPATIQSVDDSKKDIIETLVSLVTGLVATASDLIYMTTPSSVTAMHTASALSVSNQGLQTYLSDAMLQPTQFDLTTYGPGQTQSSNSDKNSGFLVLDIYNALNYPNSSTDAFNLSRPDPILQNVRSWGGYGDVKSIFDGLMAQKKTCFSDPGGAGCNTISQTDQAARGQILETIFGVHANDAFVKNYTDNDAMYNPETLFSATSYTNLNEQAKAVTFINQLSQLAAIPSARPPGLPEPMKQEEIANLKAQITNEPSTLDQIQTQQDAYVQNVMQMIAAKNMAMANLYAIHAKRIPQQAIIDKGITELDKNNQPVPVTSPLQLESYAANRRLKPAYYQEMASASPTAIARETLFLLAEIRQQLFQNQLMNERLLATISVTALGSVDAKSATLSRLSQGIKSQIDLILSGNMNTANNASSGDIPTTPKGTPSQ